MESYFLFPNLPNPPGNSCHPLLEEDAAPRRILRGAVGGGGEVDLCKVTHLRDKTLSLAPGPSEAGLRSARGAVDGRVTRMPGS